MKYFDANATTPLAPEAREAWLAAAERHWHNPASPYRAAGRAYHALEAIRAKLADLLCAPPEAIVFTSGATEANNALIRYYAEREPVAVLWSSKIEHPCVRESMRQYAAGRWCELPVTEDGVIDLSALEDALNERRPGLVCVMAANNETGAVQPWRDALELCRESGVPFHVDAAQWLGKRPLAELAAAPSLTGCAHKCGGPKGVGFWRIPEGAAGAKIFLGGEQQHGHRAGTEDYPGAAGMLAAIRAREAEMGTVRQSWLKGRNRFEQRLRETIPGVIFACADADRLENTSLVLLPRHRNTRWVAQLDKRGFAVSTGSACATAKDGPSHVLGAQGVSAEGAERAVRVSALWSTTDDDWQALADAFSDVWGTLEAEATTSAVIEI